MKPTVGRTIHFTSRGDVDGKHPPEVLAAIITKVESGTTVSLFVMYPNGTSHKSGVEFTEAPAGSEDARGKWAWPAREG
jgi:hypothetical protein